MGDLFGGVWGRFINMGGNRIASSLDVRPRDRVTAGECQGERVVTQGGGGG